MDHPGKLREIVLGLAAIGSALVALGVWIPADIDTGVVDVWRRTIRIGDAMLPSFAAAGMLLAGLVMLVRAIVLVPNGLHRVISPVFLVTSCLVMALGLTLMQVSGPLIVWLWFSGETPYRLLLDTAPWKYIGFVIGGSFMIFCFTALTSHRFSWNFVLLALVSTVLIALIYDLPFDNLLLPPNGDI
ncbi:hypothetical protein [Pseudophaeobacter sp.]|uniref:hypothetical protein n=1 Tax=Pseudophaeobacter sp. TaxID=1971739 RepID=UPI003298E150